MPFLLGQQCIRNHNMLWHSTINVTNHNADNANDLNNYWSRGLTFSDIRLRARL